MIFAKHKKKKKKKKKKTNQIGLFLAKIREIEFFDDSFKGTSGFS